MVRYARFIQEEPRDCSSSAAASAVENRVASAFDAQHCHAAVATKLEITTTARGQHVGRTPLNVLWAKMLLEGGWHLLRKQDPKGKLRKLHSMTYSLSAALDSSQKYPKGLQSLAGSIAS